MNFKVSRVPLLNELLKVSRAVSPKSPVPTLTGIKIEAKDDTLYFKTDYNSYLILKEQKGIYKVSINKRFNILNLVYEIKNNKILYIIVSICILYFLFLNSLIFKIEFDTDDTTIKKEIIKELKNNNIKLLKIKPSFEEIKDIKNKISNKFYTKIEWLEINEKGNKLIISYVIKKDKNTLEKIANRSVVAKKNGIIRKILSSSGVIVKNKNEYVSKGEEVISGNIIKDDIVISQIPANGYIFAEVWYKNTIMYPLYQKEKIYIDKTKYNIYFNFFNMNKKMYNNYESNNKKINILKNNIIPINLYIKKENKFYYKIKKNTKQKAKELALKYLENDFNKKLGKKDYIIDKKVLNLSYKKSKIKIDVLYKVYEDITDYKMLDSNMLNQKIEVN